MLERRRPSGAAGSERLANAMRTEEGEAGARKDVLSESRGLGGGAEETCPLLSPGVRHCGAERGPSAISAESALKSIIAARSI